MGIELAEGISFYDREAIIIAAFDRKEVLPDTNNFVEPSPSVREEHVAGRNHRDEIWRVITAIRNDAHTDGAYPGRKLAPLRFASLFSHLSQGRKG